MMNQNYPPDPGQTSNTVVPPLPPQQTPNVDLLSLPYHANGWRENARTAANLHLGMSILSLLISGVFVVIYLINGKEGHGGPLAFLVLFPVFEIIAAIVLIMGTNEEYAADNPIGSTTTAVVWLSVAIVSMLEKLGFVQSYILFFAVIDESMVLWCWHMIMQAIMIILFGLVVPFAMAIHAVSRDRIAPVVRPIIDTAPAVVKVTPSQFIPSAPDHNRVPHAPSKWLTGAPLE